MKQQITFFFIFLVITLSFWLIIPNEPERFLVSSDDSRLQISGIIIGDIQPQLITESINNDFFREKYILEPINYIPLEPISIFTNLTSDQSLYIFDDSINSWRAMSSSPPINWHKFTSFFIGPSLDIDFPEFIQDLEDLLEKAPLQTSGYQRFARFRLADNSSAILIPDSFHQGGCDGVFFSGTQKKQSSIFRTAQIPLAGLMQEVEIELHAIWFLDQSIKQACNLKNESR